MSLVSSTTMLSSSSSRCVLQQFTKRGLATLDSSRLEVHPASPSELKRKPEVKDLVFGKTFTDHMLKVRWTSKEGWNTPKIEPLRDLKLHPAAKVLHYAQELFEGMKAYRGVDDKIRMFRPMHNMARMNATAQRACMPTFDGKELVECIRRLVQLDQEWVPHCTSSSLYIRPTMIGTEPTLGVAAATEVELYVIVGPVGPYFATGVKPVNLLADPKYVRAWPGGCGFAKMGSNYAPTLWVGKEAEKLNCQQVLWLFGPDEELTEVGAMNIFLLLEKGKGGRRELVTPPLNGTILPGVTRRSIIELTQGWGEFDVSERRFTMPELAKALAAGNVVEMFGAGTAAVVSPVGGIYYGGKMLKIPTPEKGLSARILSSMCDITYGRVPHPWAIEIENWKVDPKQELKDYSVVAA